MRALPLLLLTLAGCSRAAPTAGGNDMQRQAQLIANQRDAMQKEAESNVTAAEQALENEGAAIFENREALLNESASGNSAADNASTAGAATK